jgi:nitronate monooxygenase
MPSSVADLLDLPIVGAPMAGGPTTPALVAAVSDAGGLGFLAAGYKTASAVASEIESVRSLTRRPFGVNLFSPVRDDVDDEAVAEYVASLRGEEERYGVACGRPVWTDDDWDAKLAVVADARPAVVSFTFGCPARDVVAWLQELDVAVWATVTAPDEARQALAAGVDALVLQAGEAGGHHGSYVNHDRPPLPAGELLARVRGLTDRPLVAAGGIATAAGVGEIVAAGAAAAQIGTALLLAPEAATSEPHRRALRGDAPTQLTRAFSGRRARGIVNRFLAEHDAAAPAAYPELHYATAPLRARARELGDADGINLWAGTSYRLACERPAAEIVEALRPREPRLRRRPLA